MKKFTVMFFLPLFLSAQQFADVVYTDGKIWTVDTSRPEAVKGPWSLFRQRNIFPNSSKVQPPSAIFHDGWTLMKNNEESKTSEALETSEVCIIDSIETQTVLLPIHPQVRCS